ncbi:MAG: LOG family protein [Blastocatellia bacterium]|nr:LOG family protein [Blastocatellia bacterium]
MKVKIGVMGSAGDASSDTKGALVEKAQGLARAIASRPLLLLTGATTGIVYVVGKVAHDAGVFHLGISPAENSKEHVEKYKLPLDACDLIVYTGFGLKGRNVVLVRSCDIVLFIAGAMGSLNEFTIAHDEGKVIGCLSGTGGVADTADYLLQKFSKDTGARVFQNHDADKLLEACLESLKS